MEPPHLLHSLHVMEGHGGWDGGRVLEDGWRGMKDGMERHGGWDEGWGMEDGMKGHEGWNGGGWRIGWRVGVGGAGGVRGMEIGKINKARLVSGINGGMLGELGEGRKRGLGGRAIGRNVAMWRRRKK